MTLRWIESDTDGGVTPEQVAAVVGPQTALVVLSHVAYRSGYLADVPAITADRARCRGARALGPLPLRRRGRHPSSTPGGSTSPSAARTSTSTAARARPRSATCAPSCRRAAPADPGLDGQQRAVRRWGRTTCRPTASGASSAARPPSSGCSPCRTCSTLVAEAGIEAIRAKSVALTEFAIELAMRCSAAYGVTIASPARRRPPRQPRHPASTTASARSTAALWERGIIPDFRAPDGLRIGLSPLSTSFAEVFAGLDAVRTLLAE